MKKKDLEAKRKKTVNELEKEVEKLTKKRDMFWVTLATGEEKNVKVANLLKKDIAQLKTIIKEKQT